MAEPSISMESKVLAELQIRYTIADADVPKLQSYIDQVGYEIKNYINQTTIPDALLFTYVSMVSDVWLGVNSDKVKSITEGDTSISYVDPLQIIEKSLEWNVKSLRAYRKLR